MSVREEQYFLASIRTMACAGGMETAAQELIGLYFKEFVLRLRVEKGALFRIMENGKIECLARCGIGASVTSLLVTDVCDKLPDLRFNQAVIYRAQETLLSRSYLLLGDIKTKLIFVAYNVSYYSRTARLMRHKESQGYYDVFLSYLVRALKQSSLEYEVGRGELSGLRGYKAFCIDLGVNTYDALVLFQVSKLSLLYESLNPREFVDCIALLSEKIAGAVKRGEQAYHIGDSYYVLCLIGTKWDVYQRVKLLLVILNDYLCSKRPLSCPDMDIRAGLLCDIKGKAEQLVNRLFGCVKKAGSGEIYVYGQLNGPTLDEAELPDVPLVGSDESFTRAAEEVVMEPQVLALEPEEADEPLSMPPEIEGLQLFEEPAVAAVVSELDKEEQGLEERPLTVISGEDVSTSPSNTGITGTVQLDTLDVVNLLGIRY